MKLLWTTFAKRDLGEIVTCIWFDNPSVSILRVVHTARQWPPQSETEDETS